MSTTALPLPRTAAPPSPWAALPIVIAGAFMVVLDFFIANVALPSIAADLNAGHAQLEWIVASYGLSVAALLITAGRLGDNHGRRAMYLEGVALFTLASIACGLAPSAEVLIAARIAQGIAGALVMPQVLAIIGTAFHGPDKAKAMGIYSMALGLAAVGGQLIGGVLVETIDWRACFLINVPIGAAALLLAPRFVPESKASERKPLDLVGVALISAAVVAVVLPLIEGRAEGWPLLTWLSFAAALVLLDLFVLHVRRAPAPVLDPALLANSAFSAGLVAQLLLWCGQAAFFVYLALYLQPGEGLSPLDAGLVFTIVAVTYVMTSAAAPRLTERLGRAVPLAGGLTLASGHGTVALTAGGSIAALAPGLALVGACMGLCLTSLNFLAVEMFDAERAGSASGVLATVQELGNALGVAITGVIFFGALGAGHVDAFAVSAVQLAAVGLGVAALTRMLPRRGHDPARVREVIAATARRGTPPAAPAAPTAAGRR